MSVEDKELMEMFSGEEKPMHPETVHVSLTDLQKNRAERRERASANTKEEKKPEHKPTYDFRDGSWTPTRDKNWLDNLKTCTKWFGLFGGLSLLLFYWEMAGLMAESVAVPSMCICTALAGWGAGKNVRCK